MFERLIRNQERHAELMGEMMRRFGVLETGPMGMNEAMNFERAVRRCARCRAVERCEHWMAATTGTEGAAAFCPNAPTFAELTRH